MGLPSPPLHHPAGASVVRSPAVIELHPTSLDTVFRRYSGYVARVAHRLLGRDDELDDVVQEVFLEAVRGLRRLRQPGAVKGWLATVTVRVAQRRLRARRFRLLLGLDGRRGYDDVAAPGASPEQRALLARVYRALDRLPARERIAWTLRHVEGESLEDVAQLLGCSLATAKRRIAAAHAALERDLGACGAKGGFDAAR